MKVLVLGGAGFVGRVVVRQLAASGWAQAIVASRRPPGAQPGTLTVCVDTLDPAGLAQALAGVDAVVNCVAGDGAAIGAGADTLVQAALGAGRPRLVHLSTMAVYGGAQGVLDERHPMNDDLGWYGHAKIQAEEAMRRYRQAGGEVVILRPGCVAGKGSDAWVGRPAYWLKAGRLGDLGTAGDGPANLVDVEDVAQAVLKALRLPLQEDAPVFNLAAPDSPRWNAYFQDLALAIHATPVKRLTARQLKREVYLRGVALKVAERVCAKLRWDLALPPSMPPSLLRLWAQQIQLDSRAATETLQLVWTPYVATLQRSAQWCAQPGVISP